MDSTDNNSMTAHSMIRQEPPPLVEHVRHPVPTAAGAARMTDVSSSSSGKINKSRCRRTTSRDHRTASGTVQQQQPPPEPGVEHGRHSPSPSGSARMPDASANSMNKSKCSRTRSRDGATASNSNDMLEAQTHVQQEPLAERVRNSLPAEEGGPRMADTSATGSMNKSRHRRTRSRDNTTASGNNILQVSQTGAVRQEPPPLVEHIRHQDNSMPETLLASQSSSKRSPATKPRIKRGLSRDSQVSPPSSMPSQSSQQNNSSREAAAAKKRGLSATAATNRSSLQPGGASRRQHAASIPALSMLSSSTQVGARLAAGFPREKFPRQSQQSMLQTGEEGTSPNGEEEPLLPDTNDSRNSGEDEEANDAQGHNSNARASSAASAASAISQDLLDLKSEHQPVQHVDGSGPLLVEATLVEDGDPANRSIGNQDSYHDEENVMGDQVIIAQAQKAQLTDFLQNRKLQCFTLLLVIVVVAAVVIAQVVVSQLSNSSSNSAGGGDATVVPIDATSSPRSAPTAPPHSNIFASNTSTSTFSPTTEPPTVSPAPTAAKFNKTDGTAFSQPPTAANFNNTNGAAFLPPIIADGASTNAPSAITGVPESLQPAATPTAMPTDDRYVFESRDELKDAIAEWTADSSSATDKYGPVQEWNIERIRDFDELFDGSNFNDNIDSWQVSDVRSLALAFHATQNFNSPLNSWDVSSVTDLDSIFEKSVFNQPLDNWDVSRATKIIQMFYDTSEFNQPIGMWNIGKAASLELMFKGALKFSQDLSQWSVSQITDLHEAFNEATSFNQPLDSWDTSNVKDMTKLFDKSVYNQPLKSWNLSSCTSLDSMFWDNQNFNQDISMWDTSAVRNIDSFAEKASSFNSDLSNWSITRVTDMHDAFKEATAFNQNLCSWGAFMRDDADVRAMFEDSGCPITDDPVRQEDGTYSPMYYDCTQIETSPTPSEASVSPAPTSST